MKSLGIDHGTVRIGLALSDPLGILASPLETVAAQPEKEALARVAGLCQERGVSTVVMGLPLHLDDSPSPASQRARAFAARLTELLPRCRLVFVDERLSTREAKDRLSRQQKRGKTAPRSLVDQVAAVVILQDYLDQQQGMALLPEEQEDFEKRN